MFGRPWTKFFARTGNTTKHLGNAFYAYQSPKSILGKTTSVMRLERNTNTPDPHHAWNSVHMEHPFAGRLKSPALRTHHEANVLGSPHA